ncbi:hypothetical protein QJ857_gp0550 [Tupanvirus soda lake]|uniref:Cyanovirin-N domain-containing protein n=2 Tax=Tupanvirus TaxID=2094720 RepID=A0A6N1P3C7_9VIRU|nr:hypothetical protein QJ857_gp0550 [Tupanvirus soda lake]QKU35491.1 hypothetical protein [Tupanvirus soda lake]
MNNSIVTVIVILILLGLVLFVQNKETAPITEPLTQMQSCVNNQLPPGTWRETCRNQHFTEGGSVLTAECATERGNYVPTSINLDSCLPQNCNVYNNNGQLECGYSSSQHGTTVPPASAPIHTPPASAPIHTPPAASTCNSNNIGGTWNLTCKNPYLTENNVVLNAECATEKGEYIPSSININNCVSQNCDIYNNNGQLECGYSLTPNQNAPTSPVFPVSPIQPTNVCTRSNIGGTWNLTCHNPNFTNNGSTLNALCANERGIYEATEIDLNTCASQNCNVYNDNGKLQCGYSSNQHGPSTPPLAPPVPAPSSQPGWTRCFSPRGTWNQTCRNQNFNPMTGVLTAQCATEQGNYVPTSINVNSCASQNCDVYNNNGQLECGYSSSQHGTTVPPASAPIHAPPAASTCPPGIPKGSWNQSCRNYYVNPFNNTLYAQCATEQGNYTNTSIDVNSCASSSACNVYNNNGRLQCGY